MDHQEQSNIELQLAQQIEFAFPDGEVEAVISLKKSDGVAAATIESTVKGMIERAERESGMAVVDHNVFKNIGMFVVKAPAALVKILVNQEEVKRAGANKTVGPA